MPALVHTHGAYTVRGGIRRIAEALGTMARHAGVDVRCATPVRRIVRDRHRVLGVETMSGERLDAALVISNVGVATYARLLDPPDPAQLRAIAGIEHKKSIQRQVEWPSQTFARTALIE